MAEEGNLDQLCLITGCEREMGKNLLEACGNNLEMAVNMHMENGEGEPAPVGPGEAPGLAPGVDQEEDPIRAPIPQRQETLVQPGFEGFEMAGRSNMNNRNRVRSVFDGFRNFEAETLHREQDAAAEPLPRGYNPNKKKTLEDLFKPPLDIMFQGDWQSARDKASNSGRWLLVNIQEPKEFQCQLLNRDLWSNIGVKSIIGEHFVFWQQYRESEEAHRYMTFYKISQWPYIAVIDPRTGENMVTWSQIDANAFPELITEFLSLHPSLETPEKEPPRKRLRTDQVADMDEEAQLAAAIKASLVETLAASNPQEEEDDISLGGWEDESDSNLLPGSNPVNGRLEGTGSNPVNGRLEGTGEPEKGEPCKAVNGGGDASWKNYLGSTDDPLTSILIRFPDGSKDPWNPPATSKLKALVLFVGSKGFDLENHEIVTNFPRRVISALDQEMSLKDHQLFPRETVFVQLKDN